MVMAKNSPQILKGFQDFGPELMSARLFMLEKIRKAFQTFGFQPMETPALESLSLLAGKYGAEERLIYKFKDQGGRSVAMRYDLTVPLARYYSDNKNSLPKPFKRYAIGPVWRAESPQKGRFREFYQCDVDILGSTSALADAEAIASVTSALEALGVKDYSIKINNRKIIDGLLSLLGISSKKFIPVLRALDKLEKQGIGVVRKELSKLEIEKDSIEKLFAYLHVSATDAKGLENSFSGDLAENKLLAEGVGELSDVLDALAAMGRRSYTVDLTLARGLDYYTGTVCEISLSKLPEIGSIAGGGRYDNLISNITGEKTMVPAVGMSIGIDRLLAALQELHLISFDLKSDILVFNLDQSLTDRYLDIVTRLRGLGIIAEVYYRPDKLEKQFKYAEKKKINYGIFLGQNEASLRQVKIKNLNTRKQWTMPVDDIATEIEKIFGQ